MNKTVDAARGGRRLSRGARRVLVGVLPACGLVSVLVPSPSNGAPPPKASVGQAAHLPPGSADLGAQSSSTSLQLDVALAPRDPVALSTFIEQLYDPSSSEYHHFLAAGQFGPNYGASESTIQNVSSELSSLGLHPGPVSSNDLIIPVTTTVSSAQSAFGVRIDHYRLPSGAAAYGNTTAPQVPSPFAGKITAITGLSDAPQAMPLSLEQSTGSTVPSVDPQTTGPSACSSAAGVSHAYTANQLAAAYGFASGAYASGRLGTGETVALFELEPYSSTDISSYESCYGISTSVNKITVDGGAGTGAGSGESALDIEDIAGLAPDATINVYEAPNSNTGVIDEYQQIANDDTAQVVSSSWGECEPESTLSVVEAEEAVFEQMATQGQSMMAAAGDTGSSDCYGQTRPHGTSAVAVDDPASDPYVTGAGGTDLTSTGSPPTEAVWNESSINDGATGGGISEDWTMPSWQQTLGVNSDSSGAPCGASSGNDCREVPDVSASADPQHGYAVFFNGRWIDIGGTSAAAPLWAALTALADEGCTSTAGLLNPALYSHGADLNDVTSGSNDYTPSGYFGGLYPAATGYDMASGLGTPTAALFSPGVLCPFAPAAAPSGVSASVANGAVGISWSSDASATSYEVFDATSPGGEVYSGTAACTVSAPTDTCTVSGLTNGTEYYFTVEAVNAAGSSAPSSEVNATPGPPPTPNGVNASGGNGSVGVSWSSDTGATSYEVFDATSPGGESYGGPAACTASAPTDTCTVSGLTNGTEYYFTVLGVNGGGSSSASAEVHATPEPPAPSAPGGVNASAANGSVGVSWSSDAGATSYEVFDATSPGGENYTGPTACTAGAPTDTCTVSGLTNGTEYYFTVLGVNGGGSSSASAEVHATPEPPAPGSPTGVSANAGIGAAGISWSSDAGAISYEVFDATSPGGENYSGVAACTASAPTDTCTVSGITNGTEYYFTVLALNAGGSSSASAEVHATPEPAPPGSPNGVGASAANGAVHVSWSSDAGASSYEVVDATSPGGENYSGPTACTASAPTDTCIVSGLTNGTEYYFTVLGVNGGGSSSASTEVHATPEAPISPPPPPPAPQHGYWLVGSDGGIFTFGSAGFFGSTGSLHLQRPVVGIVPTQSRNGYWLDASDGGIFAFGDAGFYGSIPGLGLHPAGSGLPNSLNAPIVAMVPSADGGGYFMVASDGGVFAFGDARFAGSCPGIGGCSGAAVAVMPDATGNGYWLVTAAGLVYTFGDAPYYGAPGPEGVPVTSAVRTPDGQGYWILFANGAISNYGDALSFGSPVGQMGGFDPATAIFTTSDGGGYWVASAVGAVDNYGDAPNDGSMLGTKLNGSIIAGTGW